MLDEKLNKTVFEIVALGQEINDLAYWMSRSPEERFEAIEWLRRINYGEDATTARLQRFFEFAELS